jgi:acyl dehydratase
MASFDVRFTNPAFPGDELELDAWIDGKTVSFRCRAPAQDKVVLDNGRCELRANQAPA